MTTDGVIWMMHSVSEVITEQPAISVLDSENTTDLYLP
jgi:hypothetical protein